MNKINDSKNMMDNQSHNNLQTPNQRMNEFQGTIVRKFNKKIYWLMIAIAVFLILACAFYIIAVIDGAILGTPEGELDRFLQERVKGLLRLEPTSQSEDTLSAASLNSGAIKAGLNSLNTQPDMIDISLIENLNMSLRLEPF